MDFDDVEFAVPIPHFSDYYITPQGQVFNHITGREMVLSPTEYGDLTVGLMRNGIQHRRSVKVLIAQIFVDGKTQLFDTPIQLDGNRNNLHASNIVWRPRWFAWKYVQQFSEPHPEWYEYGPIVDLINNVRYHTILEAAMIKGLLCEDIHRSILEDRRVFPTGQSFAYFR